MWYELNFPPIRIPNWPNNIETLSDSAPPLIIRLYFHIYKSLFRDYSLPLITPPI